MMMGEVVGDGSAIRGWWVMWRLVELPCDVEVEELELIEWPKVSTLLTVEPRHLYPKCVEDGNVGFPYTIASECRGLCSGPERF